MRTDFHDFVIDKARVRLDFDKSLRLANLYRDSEFFQEIILVVHRFNSKRCKKKFWKEASSSQDTSLDFLSKKTGISIGVKYLFAGELPFYYRNLLQR